MPSVIDYKQYLNRAAVRAERSLSAGYNPKLIVLACLALIVIWYIRAPLGSLWINAGDAYSDGHTLSSVSNARLLPWTETAFFPVHGVITLGEPVAKLDSQGYAYIYTHYPSGAYWMAWAIDQLGLSPLWAKQLFALATSVLGLLFWSVAWAHEGGMRLGLLFFAIAGISSWFLKLGASLHHYPFQFLLAGLLFWLWTQSWGWTRRGLLIAWVLLLFGSQVAHPLTVWSACLMTGLIISGLVPANLRHWLFLMTAPLLGLGTHFVRLVWLDPAAGVPDLLSAFVQRSGGAEWINQFSLRYFVLLALRIEYWSGFGFFILLTIFGFRYFRLNLESKEKRLHVLVFVLLVAGIAWWVIFPQHTWAHGSSYVDFFVGFTAVAIWAWFLDRGFGSLLAINKKNVFIAWLLIAGLITRLGIGYFDRVVAFPERLRDETVSGPCISDSPYLPAIEAMLHVACPTLADTGGKMSLDLDNCAGEIVRGVYAHIEEVPRINIPIGTQLYTKYRYWKEGGGSRVNRLLNPEFSVPGQPDAPLVWYEQPISWYEPVLYCYNR